MIVSECCTNWRELTEARHMIEVAHNINPDGLVKFQLFDAEGDKGKPHYDWVKAHELTFGQAKDLFDYGASIGQEVFFSVFGVKYVDWCKRIGVKRYKIAADVNDPALLSACLSTGQQVIVSIRRITSYTGITLFCPKGYPAVIQDMPMFRCYREEYYRGFSDHSIGLNTAKIALARGAQIVEKHFVLEHNKDFPDNDWSMTPADLAELVRWERLCKEMI